MGDFNSNAIWDYEHSERNHSNVVRELDKVGLVSAYHYFYYEEQGKETIPTFYLHRHLDKAYHIDHCFINKALLLKYKVLNYNDYLDKSDHVPISLLFNK